MNVTPQDSQGRIPTSTARPATVADVASARARLDEVVVDALASGMNPTDVARAAGVSQPSS